MTKGKKNGSFSDLCMRDKGKQKAVLANRFMRSDKKPAKLDPLPGEFKQEKPEDEGGL